MSRKLFFCGICHVLMIMSMSMVMACTTTGIKPERSRDSDAEPVKTMVNGKVMTAPVLIRRVEPIMPMSARKNQVRGTGGRAHGSDSRVLFQMIAA